MSVAIVLGLTVLAFAIALGVTRLLVDVLGREGMLDRPNARSSHTRPTPRGGGLGVLAAVLVAWGGLVAWTGVGQGFGGGVALTGFALLVAVSWWDDLAARRPKDGSGRHHDVHWAVRLVVHALAVVTAGTLFAPLLLYAPSTFDLALVGIAMAIGAFLWLAFMNAFNFMDGIDGIAGAEAVFVAGGAALAFWWLGGHVAHVGAALTLAAAVAGFLLWNWAPARIFMGDVGSVPIGFLLAFLMAQLASMGAWGAALALPAYFGADTLITMWRRWRAGEKITTAHRSHAYQRAAAVVGHAPVVVRMTATNLIILIAVVAGLEIGGATGQVVTLVIAGLATLELLRALERMARRPA